MEQCYFCEKENTKLLKVYTLTFKTIKNSYDIGLKNLLDDLANYLMKGGCHLSASQIVLLRSDILEEFLMKYKTNGKKITSTSLKERLICKDCFKPYAELVPLK